MWGKHINNGWRSFTRSVGLAGLYIIILASVVMGQQTVSGIVTDAQTGDPLPGVNISVKGTNTGSSSDAGGRYSLEVSSLSDTLIFSFIGYALLEEPIIGRMQIDIQMQPEAISGEEVVVIGYGTQQKTDVTGAITQMQTETIGERPVDRIDQVLAGQLAGVRVKETSGVPGKGFNIQIRGSGSITANNQPLYVIDGFPLEVRAQNSSGNFPGGNPLDNINPSDIKSIQVLKDAAAASIYGSRAANGVVIINTKQGVRGSTTIHFSTYTGWQETTKKLDILTAEEWIDRASEMIDYAWTNSGPGRTADQTAAEREAILGGFNRNYIKDERWFQEGHPGLQFVDWQEEFFRRGIVQNHKLSASGGNESVRYFVSGDFLDKQGIAKGVGYERYSARANIDVSPNENLTFGLKLNPSHSTIDDPGVEGKDQQMHITVGMVPVVEADVGLQTGVEPNEIYTWGNSRISPVAVLEETIGETNLFRTLATVYGEYDVSDKVFLKSTLNLDYTDSQSKRYTPGRVTRNRNTSGSFGGYKRQTFVNENTLQYRDTYAGAHNISVLAGISYNVNNFNDWYISGNFDVEGITTLNAAIINAGGTETSESKSTMLSYFGRLQYDYNGRYLLTASIRRDGSSRFGQNSKWGVFPSVSAGWRLSNEQFMDGISQISDLKLRVSWGISGNNGIGDYSHIAMLNFANYSFGGGYANGLVPGNYPNPNLGWEESETINLGIDAGLFQDRIYTSFDYYTKRNKDLLLSIPVPSATGFTTALTNIGEVLNKGWELQINTRNTQNNLLWNTNISLAHNTNEVKKLGPENTPLLGGAHDIPHNITMVGEPMYSLYLVQQIGILSQEDIDNGAALYGNQEAGDPRYLDVNDDGIISPDDRVLSGHPDPDYVWGITNTFAYKGFDLSVLIEGQWGGKIYSTFGRAIDRTGMGFVDNALGDHHNRWRTPESPGNGEVGKANSSFGRIKNTDWLYSSDYWRVKNITLGYDVGRHLASVPAISGMRVYATMENWFGRDKYYGGFNPEAVNNNGDDYGAFPLAKSVIFGVNLRF